jgi:hypothetical protein
MNELPIFAYYVQPIYQAQLDIGDKVPVIIVKDGVEGYFETDYEVSSWNELSALNVDIGCTIEDAFVLGSLSMFPNGDIDRLYGLTDRVFSNRIK